jgi:diguanylate cyclase (GGDEF)-like protein
MSELKDRILIIDDSILNIKMLSDILSEDYEVLYAQSPEDGLKIAIEEKPSLILLDIIMPKIDGYEICRRIKKDSSIGEIPVIFITSLNEEREEQKGLEMGAIDYIHKPFSTAVVKLRVKNHLELKRHRDMLEKLSFIDGLTGIPNRRQFNLFLEHEWHSAMRAHSPISLIMIDIDFFKLFNDNYGHIAGDECLIKVAGALNKVKRRTTDLVARYGGEEFVCILPCTDIDGAYLIAEKLKESIDGLGILHEYSEISRNVTVSIGVSTLIPMKEDTPEKLIHMADKLLYEAKRNGRNQIKGQS